MQKLLSLTILISLFYSCNSDRQNNTAREEQTEKEIVKKDTPPPPPVVKQVEITYHPLKMKDSGKKVLNAFDEERQLLILALNRVDKANLGRVDTLIIPDTFLSDRNSYSAFPLTVSSLAQVKKMVFFSYPAQVYGIYENGNLLKWGPTSMGKKSSKTPTGLFFANWKGKEVISSIDDEWVLKWNFNIQNKMGVGWHQYAMPGYPASHSCLRLYADEAKFLYDWADQWKLKDGQLVANGTPVIVFGEYPFGSRRPWLNLLEDPKVLTISEKEMNELIAPHLEKILAEQEKLDNVKAQTQMDTTQKINQ
jgi:hypothetical protein